MIRKYLTDKEETEFQQRCSKNAIATKAYQEPGTTSLCGCHLEISSNDKIYFFSKFYTYFSFFRTKFLIIVVLMFIVHCSRWQEFRSLSTIQIRNNRKNNNDNYNQLIWRSDILVYVVQMANGDDWRRLISLECHTMMIRIETMGHQNRYGRNENEIGKSTTPGQTRQDQTTRLTNRDARMATIFFEGKKKRMK